MHFFRNVIGVLLTSVAVAASTVPKIKICDRSDCPEVSRMAMGTLHLGDSISGLTDPKDINAWITHAVSLGITLFDLADVYPVKGGTSGDSAKLFGEALAISPGLRENITIVAKMDIIFPSAIDTTTEHLTSTVDWFLDSVKTSYLDIMLLHYSNSNMNAEAVAELFKNLKSSGKVKHFGVSNHYPSKFDLLQAKLDVVTNGDIKLVTHEFELSVWNPSYLNYNNGIVDHAYQNGLHALAWCPLGGDPIGGLNRLFVRQGTRQLRIRHALKSVGKAIGVMTEEQLNACGDDLLCSSDNEAVVALAWLLSHPSGAIPLLGTTNLDRQTLYVTAFNYVDKMTNDLWWQIAGAGGVCPLGDSQCNYDEYKG